MAAPDDLLFLNMLNAILLDYKNELRILKSAVKDCETAATDPTSTYGPAHYAEHVAGLQLRIQEQEALIETTEKQRASVERHLASQPKT